SHTAPTSSSRSRTSAAVPPCTPSPPPRSSRPGDARPCAHPTAPAQWTDGSPACNRRTRMPRLAALLLLSVTLVPGARAEQTCPGPRGPSREPPPDRFDPASLKELPKDFLEDAAACILYSATTNLVEADGTVEATTHEVTRLAGRKGIEKVGEYRNI